MAAQLEPERQEYARPNSISGGVGRGVGEFIAFFEQPAVLTGHRPADFFARVEAAFEAHSPAAVGEAFVPGDVIVGAMVAIDPAGAHSALHLDHH
jgi:hypothetical protein